MRTFKMVLAAGLLAATAGLAHAERGEPGDNLLVRQDAQQAPVATEGRNATVYRPATEPRTTAQSPRYEAAQQGEGLGYNVGGDR